jgi:hypothetical protein
MPDKPREDNTTNYTIWITTDSAANYATQFAIDIDTKLSTLSTTDFEAGITRSSTWYAIEDAITKAMRDVS